MSNGIGGPSGPRFDPIVAPGDNPNAGDAPAADRGAALERIVFAPSVLEAGNAGEAGRDFVLVGDANEAPNPGGEVKSRLDKVKDFFKGLGESISDAFSKIGDKIASAAGAIKDFFVSLSPSSRAHEASQTALLAGVIDNAVIDLETAYSRYAEGLGEGDVPQTRAQFLNAQLGMAQQHGVVPDGVRNVAARIDNASEQASVQHNEGRAAMKEAITELLTERPDLTPLMDWSLEKGLDSAFPTQADTLFRSNTAYTKAVAYIAGETMELGDLGAPALAALEARIEAGRDAGVLTETSNLSLSTMTAEVAEVVVGAARDYLDAILSEGEGSLSAGISAEMSDILEQVTNEINGRDGVAEAEMQGAIKKTLINHLFLRGVSGDMVSSLSARYEGVARSMNVKGMQVMQSFMNGMTEQKTYSPAAQQEYQALFEEMAPRLETFLQSVGLPQNGGDV